MSEAKDQIIRDLLEALVGVLPYTEAERLAEAARVRLGAYRNPINTAISAAHAAIAKAEAQS